MQNTASIMNRPRISSTPNNMLSASSRALGSVQTMSAIRLPSTRAAVPTAMQLTRRGSAALHRIWVNMPLGRRNSVSSCPLRTMPGKAPVMPRPKNSVR